MLFLCAAAVACGRFILLRQFFQRAVIGGGMERGARRGRLLFSGGPVGARFGAQLAGVGAQKAPSRHKNVGWQKRKRS